MQDSSDSRRVNKVELSIAARKRIGRVYRGAELKAMHIASAVSRPPFGASLERNSSTALSIAGRCRNLRTRAHR
ncbi:hypothetical protein WN51_02486 [Melipona quadrifasciata]|uniref:Uncharacterized protein n=1 Tax=Melipona quadrifasciata TaxID=166423 RepID=A0A0M8ZWP2_9HYME|nr:hypothetical protein WN51_02486 [Melipona quadrifasciata]